MRARVRAALRAAVERVAGPLVRMAFRADADGSDFVRRFAAERACRASDFGDAALRPSRLRAARTARPRVVKVVEPSLAVIG